MNIKTLDDLQDKYIGPKGSVERDVYEKELADLMIGFQIRDARIKLDFTQEQLAERVNKKRAFISRIENDGSNLTIKTLRDIVERGLGGKLKIEVQL
ncbi:helix-turn-helix domain-containing protein [uncultured Bacteroides sp.]|jgi:ribosome-binding protein aMBF1 (putative translation factor)|uniref:helix-turn-helix domain-containing protein n=1 Tax=uncultured Bacteroides sp. TaxID=162156 RepID=UPI002068E10D|nr:helix-turn-helix transcriptional regulator [uncultured Bacteroides sp.]DAR49985.1 MAG TPA: helix-turn-helix domain protein [Caudoviricetes sp.]